MRARWLLPALISMGLSACNLAGDVTPPPGASAPLAPPGGTSAPVSEVMAPPATLPDPTAGQSIYLERCAPCHGQDGLGAGPQAADLPVAPSPLGDPALAGEDSPADWYRVVTEGRMARFMPPFSSLSDQERWDVVGYVLNLSRPAGADSAGALYADKCAQCHGDEGQGAGTGPPLVEPSAFAGRTRGEIEGVIAEGVGPAMPSFSDALSSEEQRAVAYFVQALALGPSPSDGETVQPEQPAQPAAGVAAIRGQVVDGADGEPLEAALEVTLHAFDGQERVLETSTRVDPRGAFTFRELESVPGRLFMVTAEYEDVLYSSEVVHLDEEGGTRELPLTVYGTTNDASRVRALRLHLLIDEPSDGVLRAVELWVLANEGGQTVAPVDDQGGLEFELPQGATNLRFEDSLLAERYQATEDGFRLRTPLRPGGEGDQVVFSFDLPVDGAVDLRQRMTVPVEATTVLVVDSGPDLTGDGLAYRGLRQAGGQQLRQYDLGPMQAGQQLALELQPPPLWRQLLPRSVSTSWAIGVVALVLAAGAIAWWYRPWISGEAQPTEADRPEEGHAADRRSQLLEAIAELDEAYEQGGLAETLFRRRRQQLKDQLIDLIENQHDQG